MPRGCLVVRVFTREGAGGNHLGVVNDVMDLETEVMQSIAADLGYSETVFVDWQPGTSPDVRIFTPGEELPFAGHPLVGTAWVLNVMGPGGVDALHCGIGTVEVRVDQELTWIDVHGVGEVAPAGDAGEWVTRCGLADVTDVSKVMMPLEYVLAELASPSAVAEAVVDSEVVGERFGLMVWAREGSAIKARFFVPSTAIDEDPATGSAAVALARLLAHRGEETGAVTIFQGDEIGYPSTIQVRWDGDAVSIGGTVVHDESRMLEM